MSRLGRVWLTSAFLLLMMISLPLLTEGAEENRVLAVVQRMESAFKTVEDYTCEVEQIFYQDGGENKRYQFKFYFKREKKIRVDFSYPYSSVTIFFKEGDKEVTVLPLRSLRAVKFRLSIDNPLILTPAGQRINQTDMDYFINFLLKNLEKVEQGTDEFSEDNDQIRFWLWGYDYIGGKNPEKYRIIVSKRNWLPIRIERYDLEGKPLEASIIQGYAINAPLSDKLFVP
ncbi:MAG: LolA family protein [Thermodesulfobacteriota bacterium]